jgi:hypothetical protein
MAKMPVFRQKMHILRRFLACFRLYRGAFPQGHSSEDADYKQVKIICKLLRPVENKLGGVGKKQGLGTRD